MQIHLKYSSAYVHLYLLILINLIANVLTFPNNSFQTESRYNIFNKLFMILNEMTTPPRILKPTPLFNYCKTLDGKTKRDFEMVIARYDEDISWSDHYKSFRTIYNKGEPIYNVEAIHLKNEGHHGGTILTHIIQNYDSLADATFFTHGSFNYRDDMIIKDTYPCHRLFSDFIVTDPNALIYIHRDDVPHPFENFYDYPDTAETVYQRIFDMPYPPKRYIWGAGKIVTVGKNLIRKRPKHFYENVLAFIMSPYNGEKPPLNIYRTRTLYMERFLLLFFKELIEK